MSDDVEPLRERVEELESFVNRELDGWDFER